MLHRKVKSGVLRELYYYLVLVDDLNYGSATYIIPF